MADDGACAPWRGNILRENGPRAYDAYIGDFRIDGLYAGVLYTYGLCAGELHDGDH
ncbi:MAG: hypothetical protein SPD11_12020 [Sphaerochaetaceae bacterium]|nr:hypothetical protein [Sphaerochaetaceae bacterium]